MTENPLPCALEFFILVFDFWQRIRTIHRDFQHPPYLTRLTYRKRCGNRNLDNHVCAVPSRQQLY